MSQAQKPNLNRKSKRATRFENQARQKEQMDFHLKGVGLYLYQNNTKGTLMLPKATVSGITRIEPGKQWEGDSYYMTLVRSNMACLIRELVPPEENKKMNEEKLILDQPETVTTKGVVEQVVEQPVPVKSKKKVVVETVPATDVLLTEDPLEGVVILN